MEYTKAMHKDVMEYFSDLNDISGIMFLETISIFSIFGFLQLKHNNILLGSISFLVSIFFEIIREKKIDRMNKILKKIKQITGKDISYENFEFEENKINLIEKSQKDEARYLYYKYHFEDINNNKELDSKVKKELNSLSYLN